MNKQLFMAEALKLAAKGLYTAHPNPRVGCILVKDSKIIGQGFHLKAGSPHAEIEALSQAGESAKGATCFVTLEPCSHYGRTGPCAKALIKAGIKACYIATEDPNHLVSGQGIKALEAAGITVEVGLLQSEAEQLNRGFFSRMQRNQPVVTLKVASSLDGRTAMQSGESKWITSKEARQDVHRLRAQSGAILMGVDTVIKDEPLMTVRDSSVLQNMISQENFEQPLRVILDTHLRMPVKANVFQQPGKTLVITSNLVEKHKQEEWLSHFKGDSNTELLSVSLQNGRVSIPEVLNLLAEYSINDILVEAGQTLAGSFIQQGLVDNLVLYFAPKFLGSNTKGMAYLPGLEHLQDHIALKIDSVSQVGPDIKVLATPLIKRD